MPAAAATPPPLPGNPAIPPVPPVPASPPVAPVPASPRGRPRTITRERITEAGIAQGLPKLTFVGVAAALGVSHMALYKHVAGLAALKTLVAEEMFTRWQIPPPLASEGTGDAALAAYLLRFAESAQAFVRAHPGITPHVLQRAAATAPMLQKIDAHQREVARVFDLPAEQARWLLATVAFHGMAVADTVHAVAADVPSGTEPGTEPGGDAARVAAANRAALTAAAEMQAELARGMHALVVGALALVRTEAARAPADAALAAVMLARDAL